jgi:hypothetical protein
MRTILAKSSLPGQERLSNWLGQGSASTRKCVYRKTTGLPEVPDNPRNVTGTVPAVVEVGPSGDDEDPPGGQGVIDHNVCGLPNALSDLSALALLRSARSHDIEDCVTYQETVSPCLPDIMDLNHQIRDRNIYAGCIFFLVFGKARKEVAVSIDHRVARRLYTYKDSARQS